MTGDGWLADAFDFSGTLFLVRFHGVWMLASLALGAWVGWHMAKTPPPPPGAEEGA